MYAVCDNKCCKLGACSPGAWSSWQPMSCVCVSSSLFVSDILFTKTWQLVCWLVTACVLLVHRSQFSMYMTACVLRVEHSELWRVCGSQLVLYEAASVFHMKQPICCVCGSQLWVMCQWQLFFASQRELVGYMLGWVVMCVFVVACRMHVNASSWHIGCVELECFQWLSQSLACGTRMCILATYRIYGSCPCTIIN